MFNLHYSTVNRKLGMCLNFSAVTVKLGIRFLQTDQNKWKLITLWRCDYFMKIEHNFWGKERCFRFRDLDLDLTQSNKSKYFSIDFNRYEFLTCINNRDSYLSVYLIAVPWSLFEIDYLVEPCISTLVPPLLQITYHDFYRPLCTKNSIMQ